MCPMSTNIGLMSKFGRSYELRDWQTSSLHLRHDCLLKELSEVIFGTESVITKAFLQTIS